LCAPSSMVVMIVSLLLFLFWLFQHIITNRGVSETV
jgi:hypothetical protein